MATTEPWQPLGLLDFFVVGMVSTFQVAAFGVCIHLVQWRKWPPYVTKNVNVVIISTFAGILWTAAKAIEVGFIRRSAGDVLAACDFERLLAWGTLLVHVSAFFVRVYRMKRILIDHDEHMWRTEHQILFLSGVSLIPVVTTWLIPGTATMRHYPRVRPRLWGPRWAPRQMCIIQETIFSRTEFVCIRRLKTVRKQFNEYHTLTHTLMWLTVALLSYAVVVVVLLDGRHVVIRRVAIFYPMITTYILLWGSIREPFTKKILGDDEYLWSYTKGFSELPSPAQLKASLAEQLSVEQLRTEFRRYIKTKVAQELVDFYLDSLDREENHGLPNPGVFASAVCANVRVFLASQAVTMRIVDRFVREDSPDQVNISQECRDHILATDVTAYDIFDGARKEVLAVMETNFQSDFVATEGFRRIANASEVEQREIRLLQADGIIPFSPTTPLSPLSPASLHPTRLLNALKRLRILRWFGSSAELDSRIGADPFEARRGKVGVNGATRRTRGGAGSGGTRVYCDGTPDDGCPPIRSDSPSAHSCASSPAATDDALRVRVVVEEGRGRIPAGFTTPDAAGEGARGGSAFLTPANGGGYTPNGHGSEPLDGFTTPVREDGFRTPVRGDDFRTPV
ncbi:unnamed protein product [Scytosiphon promiscuus]